MGILRFYLALCVIATHCGFTGLLSANYAVECFYIISGFYMSLVLNEKYTLQNENKLFYKKRFLRLLPPYWLYAILALCVSLWVTHITTHSPEMLFQFDLLQQANMSFFTKLYLIFSNLFLIGQDNAMFLAIDESSGSFFYPYNPFAEPFPAIRFYSIQVAWSVGLEFLFYIIAPFILRKGIKTVLPIFLISIFLKLFIRSYIGMNDSNWTFRFFPCELCFFCLGYFCYRLYKNQSYIKYIYKFNKYILMWGVIIFFAFPFLHLPYFIGLITLIITMVGYVPSAFHDYKKNLIDRNIGELSYLMYLAHPMIIALVQLYTADTNVLFILVSIFTILFTYITFKYFVTPLEKFRNKVR